MAAALRLSRRHLGLTSTNPSVACLIVRNDGHGARIVGAAVTATGGRPHAETQAVQAAGDHARGATAYVTLEPCSHHGRTPPCVDALIEAGIERVVIAVTDPDHRVHGSGIARLRANGITVETGLLGSEGERELTAYLSRQRRHRPHVTLKLAVSADGMIGRRDAGQVRITGDVSRAQVQVLRAQTDAILVGIGTAIADDPQLTVRLPGLEARSPIRIVLDRKLDLPLTSKLVRTARDVPVIVVGLAPEPLTPPSVGQFPFGLAEGKTHEPDISPSSGEINVGLELEAAGVKVLALDPSRLHDLLSDLASRGISSLLVEGGAQVARSFLAAGLVDRLLLFTSPVLIGKGGIAAPVTRDTLPSGMVLVRRLQFGDDICDDYEREKACSPES